MTAPFDVTGIDFALTALFLTVFIEQWLSTKDHASAIIGVAASVLCLLLFGADGFLIPAMASMLIALTILRNRGVWPDMWDKVVSSGNIADFQTVFNLVTAVVLVPFTGLLVKSSMLIVKPDKKQEASNERFKPLESLDPKLYVSPAMLIDS